MSSCENTWAGRFVISLQLFSWCAVGALLLHRGITSIKDDARNAVVASKSTQDNNSYVEKTNQLEDTNTVVDKSLSPDKKLAGKIDLIEKPNTLSSKSNYVGNYVEKQTGNANKSIIETNSTGTLNTSTTILTRGEEIRNNATTKTISTPKTSSTVHNVRVSASNRNNYSLTPSGAVMAAIGGIMLIVGPTIVVLRCCESFSRGRRFNKLSADDLALYMATHDRPPSYEEVEGRAPRYSMLFPDPEESSST